MKRKFVEGDLPPAKQFKDERPSFLCPESWLARVEAWCVDQDMVWLLTQDDTKALDLVRLDPCSVQRASHLERLLPLPSTLCRMISSYDDKCVFQTKTKVWTMSEWWQHEFFYHTRACMMRKSGDDLFIATQHSVTHIRIGPSIEPKLIKPNAATLCLDTQANRVLIRVPGALLDALSLSFVVQFGAHPIDRMDMDMHGNIWAMEQGFTSVSVYGPVQNQAPGKRIIQHTRLFDPSTCMAVDHHGGFFFTDRHGIQHLDLLHGGKNPQTQLVWSLGKFSKQCIFDIQHMMYDHQRRGVFFCIGNKLTFVHFTVVDKLISKDG